MPRGDPAQVPVGQPHRRPLFIVQRAVTLDPESRFWPPRRAISPRRRAGETQPESSKVPPPPEPPRFGVGRLSGLTGAGAGETTGCCVCVVCWDSAVEVLGWV